MNRIQQICDRLSGDGLSYGVTKDQKTVIVYCGEDRAEYQVETNQACVTRGSDVAPICNFDDMVAHMKGERKASLNVVSTDRPICDRFPT